MSGAGITPDRVVAGLALPYGLEVFLLGRRLVFEPLSLFWPDGAPIRMLRDHDHSLRLGRAVDLAHTPAGLDPTLVVDPGPAGDRALARIADGTERGLSVGVTFVDVVRLRGTYVVRSALLREISLTTRPVVATARVTLWPGNTVRSSK